MPTVLRLGGLRVVIYLNDHAPAHVHVLGPGWVVVVELIEGKLREIINCSEHEARGVLRSVMEHRDELLDAWRRLHG